MIVHARIAQADQLNPLSATLRHMSTGKYEKIGEAIGDGSYGTVWKGIDQETSRQVAMKQVKIPNEMRTEGIPTTTIREIRALRALTHPNIVKMHEVYTEGPGSEGSPDDIYLIFEYAPQDLAGLMFQKKNQKKNLELAEIQSFSRQIPAGLGHCHACRIIHRDLKPANILLFGDGTLKLCDFGLCRIVKELEPQPYTAEVITIWYSVVISAFCMSASLSIAVRCSLCQMMHGDRRWSYGSREPFGQS